jgi:C1A family cysteine protease
MKATAQALIDKGICEQIFWPYIPNATMKPLPGAYENASKFKVEAKYTRITNERELRAVLVQIGPVLAGVVVFKNWFRAKQGHIPNPSFWERLMGPLGGHAITICGYLDKTQEYQFINSWGSDWGDKGFGYITYAHMKSIIIDSYALVDIDDPLSYAKKAKDLKFWEKWKRWI